MSQVTAVERMHRLMQMKDLIDEGITEPAAIAERIGCELNTVKRNLKFIDDLRIAELTGREIADKRQEIYLELMDASAKAKKQFEAIIENETSVNSLAAKRFFDAWLAALQMRAKLFGVIIEKPEQYIQINNLQGDYNSTIDIPISESVRKKLSEALKETHERRVAEECSGTEDSF